MTREQQDKLWNDLSEQKQLVIKKLYEGYSQGDLGAEKLLEELYGSHNLNPKPLTYEDVAEELFDSTDTFYISDVGSIILAEGGRLIYDKYKLPNNSTSRQQAEKLLAINKLLNVAKYLNGDWKPDWENNEEEKWTIRLVWNENNKPVIKVGFYFGTADGTIGHCNNTFVYFRTKELAEQAIQILGEETIRLALSTDY